MLWCAGVNRERRATLTISAVFRCLHVGFATVALAASCTSPIEPGITAECSGGQLAGNFVSSPRNRKTALFVIDDSTALSARSSEVGDALRATVRRWVNPPCDDEQSNRDPFVRCRRSFRRGDSSSQPQRNEVDFAFVMATRPDGTRACDDAFDTHGGRLISTASVPDGLFEWRPSEFTDLSEAEAQLDALLAQVDEVATRVSELMAQSRCSSSQPLETLAQLLVVESNDERLQAQRTRLTHQHLALIVLSGADDDSRDSSLGLLPLQRYLNAFSSDRVCPNTTTFDPAMCDAPHPNPLHRSTGPIPVTMDLVGPAGVTESCGSTDPAGSHELDRGVPGTRLEAASSGLLQSRSAPWCFSSIEAPEDPSFMAPLFDSCSHEHPAASCHPRVTLDSDVESSEYGRASCRVFERREASGACVCPSPARQEVGSDVLAAPSVVRFMGQFGTDAGCLCEIIQLTGTALHECQTRHFSSVVHEPQGWCFIDPAVGVGSDELVETCPVAMKSKVRWLGHDVPAPGSWVLSVCSDHHCADGE